MKMTAFGGDTWNSSKQTCQIDGLRDAGNWVLVCLDLREKNATAGTAGTAWPICTKGMVGVEVSLSIAIEFNETGCYVIDH